MRFLLDMNLPPAMADWLRSEGHDAIHVLDAGYANMPDHLVFGYAVDQQRVLITFDLDFGEIVGLAGAKNPGVLLLRVRRAQPAYLRQRILVAIQRAADALTTGAIVLVEDARIRIRQAPSETG